MPSDLFEKITNRISTVIHELEIDEDYRELLLSVVFRSVRLYQAQNADRLPAILLPRLWCVGLGGDPDQVTGVTAAWFLLQLAAYWLDKVEDAELEETPLASLGTGVVANVSIGLIFLAQYVLDRLEADDQVNPAVAADIRTAYSRGILCVCSGQHIDLMAEFNSLDQVWQSFEKKSGYFFGLACFAGARLATADLNLLRAANEYGRNLGILLQIADEQEELLLDVPEKWERCTCLQHFGRK